MEHLAAGLGLPPPAVATEDRSIPGPGGPLKLRIYHPDVSGTLPALLYVHGGGFVIGDLETHDAVCRTLCHDVAAVVLAVDYRGFGKSTQELPSETLAAEDARAAWDWLAQQHPDRPRYIFGHSLGGAIAIDLATRVQDERGTLVEGTFTSIPDVVSTFRWGWLPISPLITQRFESVRKVADIGSPLLVVHGSEDRLIKPELGQKLFEAARGPKAFVLVEGGSHHNTNSVGQPQYRQALAELFGLGPTPTDPDPTPQALR